MRETAIVVFALLVSTVSIGAADVKERSIAPVILADYGGDWLTTVTSINSRGDMAGWATRDDGDWVAFIRTRRGGDEAIADRALTRDINDRGEVVGLLYPCNDDDCTFREEGFLWSRERGLENLGSFHPFAINDRGDIAGVCSTEEQACVMRDGVIAAVGERGSEAHDLNTRGEIVGVYGDNRAFHVSRDGEFTDIGRAVAEAINDRGVIAGYRFARFGTLGEHGVTTAWAAGRARSPRRTPSLGLGINKKGWVIAFESSESYYFAWNPATNGRAVLAGLPGESVLVLDISDGGDAVGRVGSHAALWRVRARHLNAPAQR